MTSDEPAFGADGEPVHRRGVVESEPGLYFMGLLFQYALSSDVLPGMGRHAEFIANHIASRSAEGHRADGAQTHAGVGR
jgi:putative flavoprotein involved in K+ transport